MPAPAAISRMVVSSNPLRRKRSMAASRMRARVSSLLEVGFISIQYSTDGSRLGAVALEAFAVAATAAEPVEDVQVREMHEAEHHENRANLVADQFDGLARALKLRIS